MNMNYENRMRAAAWVSVLLHLALAVAAWWYRPAFVFGLPTVVPGPIELSVATLPQPDAEDQHQLVDVATPAVAPVKPTDLIATQDSNAQDTAPVTAPERGPSVDMVSPVDTLGAKAGEAPAAPAPPSPTSPEPAPSPPKPVAVASAVPMAMQPAPEKVAEPAPPASNASTGSGAAEDQPTRGRPNRSVEHAGVRGFEAMRDQIAPYLKRVEDEVEKRWREMLLTKYTGSKATEAQVECEIGADGKIVSLRITGTPDDRVYAALCKEAIEKAGPFGAFPFEVPEIYRNKNLEIRWSFHFL